MPFTVQDFHDLVQLLDERADWRAELRRILLTDELLALPEVTRDLAACTESQLVSISERLDRLTVVQVHTDSQLAALTGRLDRLADGQERTNAQLAALTQRVDDLIKALDRIAVQLAELVSLSKRFDTDIGTLKGEALERRYERRAGVYFDDLIRRATPIPSGLYAEQLQHAMEQGILTPAERADAIRLDLLIQGLTPRDKSDAYLAVEISSTILINDIVRAARRAELLRRVYDTVIPVAAGEKVTTPAREKAEELGVRLILDGRTLDEDDQV